MKSTKNKLKIKRNLIMIQTVEGFKFTVFYNWIDKKLKNSCETLSYTVINGWFRPSGLIGIIHRVRS
jgi:hypothetical protein